MKVLLISPRGSNLYSKLELALPPLGIAYLAAVIRNAGHEVAINDRGIEAHPLKPGDFEKYDLVGISADTSRYTEAVEIARIVKIVGKQVVMGGYHVTFLDKEALDTGLVDFVIRGEAEEIFVELLRVIENGGDLKKVKGISYLIHGEYVRNMDALPPKNLNALPFPARDLLKMDQYKSMMAGLPLTNLITSRGCPFNCYFCSSSKFGGLKWRYRSAKSIVNEMEILYNEYDFRAFAFMDDNFTLSKQRVFDFADELEKRKMTDVHWWCFSRVDILIKNEDMVKRMAEAGAWEIFLGLESHNENTLDDYHKNIGNSEQDEAIRLLKKYGINIHASFIIGDVNETEDMILQTIRWAKEINSRTSQFSILTPYPGTALYQDVERENRFLHKNWERYDGLHPTIRTNNISPKRLQQLFQKSYRMVYINKHRILHNQHHRIDGIRQSFTIDDILKPLTLFINFRIEMFKHRKRRSHSGNKS